jgi:hypothetical protein
MNESSPPPAVNRPPKLAPGRRWAVSPLMLSALVYPGLGQLVQRRWLAGTAAILGFTVSTGWFLVAAARAALAYYALAFDFEGAAGSAVRPRDIVVPFGVALAVYVAAVIDTAVADARTRRGAT